MQPSLLTAIGLAWLIWIAYWFVSATRVKQVERTDNVGAILAYRIPMVIGAVFLIATGPRTWLPWLWWRWLPASSDWSALGLALVLLGLAFACWARVVLGRNWSATVQLKKEHELIVVGPYRWTRHPIYTGMLLAMLGTAVAIGEWRGLLAIALVFTGLWFKLRHEEAWMRERFGTSYVDYMRRVKALIPGIL
ncbi:MAG: isoprenylcysteine carboxylmethyltransferase family protein [Rhodanobacteraceae bacterium]|nr:MAG: isoprenylcysteine carboxylmethyltransferase family protein [Rhodanobacteraceae bacterium]